MNIKEKDINRLSKDLKEYYKSLGITKLGFYRDSDDEKWRERVFLSDEMAVTNIDDVCHWKQYHEWFPKEEKTFKASRPTISKESIDSFHEGSKNFALKINDFLRSTDTNSTQKIKSLEEENNNLKRRLNARSIDLADLRKRDRTKECRISCLNIEVESLYKNIKERQLRTSRLLDKYRKLEKEIESCRNTNRVVGENNISLRSENNELRKLNTELQSMLDLEEGKYVPYLSEQTTIALENINLKKELKEVKRKLNSVSSYLDFSRKLLEEEKQRRKQDIDDLNYFEKNREELESEIESCRKTNRVVGENNIFLRQKINELNQTKNKEK